MTAGMTASIRKTYKALSACILRRAGLILFLCLFFLMVRVFLMPAVTPRAMRALLAHPAKAGFALSADEREAISDGLSGYLSGTRESAQVYLSLNNQSVPAFQPHELLHLKDVRDLFFLSSTLASIAFCISLAVIIVTLTANTPRLAERVKTLAGATQAATLAVFGILALLALLGVLWFDQAFIILHKLLFSNDLWLLDPQKDLLIQLMPQRFFVEYARYAIKLVLSILSALLVAATAVRASASFTLKKTTTFLIWSKP